MCFHPDIAFQIALHHIGESHQGVDTLTDTHYLQHCTTLSQRDEQAERPQRVQLSVVILNVCVRPILEQITGMNELHRAVKPQMSPVSTPFSLFTTVDNSGHLEEINKNKATCAVIPSFFWGDFQTIVSRYLILREFQEKRKWSVFITMSGDVYSKQMLQREVISKWPRAKKT